MPLFEVWGRVFMSQGVGMGREWIRTKLLLKSKRRAQCLVVKYIRVITIGLLAESVNNISIIDDITRKLPHFCSITWDASETHKTIAFNFVF